MTGQRDPTTKLYMINMTETPTLMTAPPFPDSFFANHVYETKTKQDLILFYHAACFRNPKSPSSKSLNEMLLHHGLA